MAGSFGSTSLKSGDNAYQRRTSSTFCDIVPRLSRGEVRARALQALPALGVPTTFCQLAGAADTALTTCGPRSRVGATLSRTAAFAQYRRERLTNEHAWKPVAGPHRAQARRGRRALGLWRPRRDQGV